MREVCVTIEHIRHAGLPETGHIIEHFHLGEYCDMKGAMHLIHFLMSADDYTYHHFFGRIRIREANSSCY